MRSPKSLSEEFGFACFTRIYRAKAGRFSDYPSTDYNPYFGLHIDPAGHRMLPEMTQVQPVKLFSLLAFGLLFPLFLLAFGGCATPLSQTAQAEQERQRVAHEPNWSSPEALAAREKLSKEYVAILEAAYPAYNGIHIESALLPYELMASHPLFTGYEFASGPLSQVVRDWIAANSEQFAVAGIGSVGIYPESGHNKHWFYTKPAAQ